MTAANSKIFSLTCSDQALSFEARAVPRSDDGPDQALIFELDTAARPYPNWPTPLRRGEFLRAKVRRDFKKSEARGDSGRVAVIP